MTISRYTVHLPSKDIRMLIQQINGKTTSIRCCLLAYSIIDNELQHGQICSYNYLPHKKWQNHQPGLPCPSNHWFLQLTDFCYYHAQNMYDSIVPVVALLTCCFEDACENITRNSLASFQSFDSFLNTVSADGSQGSYCLTIAFHHIGMEVLHIIS